MRRCFVRFARTGGGSQLPGARKNHLIGESGDFSASRVFPADEVVYYKQGAQQAAALCDEQVVYQPLPAAEGGHVFVVRVIGIVGGERIEQLVKQLVVAVRFMDTDSYDDIYAEMDRVGQALGRPYYKIPCGGSNAIGALGYVNCMKEIADTGLHFDYVCCAEGSGGTHAGVALGAKLFMPETQTVGLMVDSDPFDVITTRIMQETAKLLELDFVPTVEDVHLVDMCGPGYAIPSAEGNAAIRMMAANEGLFLDPVYTGKAFAGLIKLAREGKFKPTDNVLYLYSGGAGGLFAIDIDLG